MGVVILFGAANEITYQNVSWNFYNIYCIHNFLVKTYFSKILYYLFENKRVDDEEGKV